LSVEVSRPVLLPKPDLMSDLISIFTLARLPDQAWRGAAPVCAQRIDDGL